DFSDYKTHLANFYEPAGYAPAWLQEGQPTFQALALIEQFKDAWRRGLVPEDYDASRWDARVEALKGPDADPARFDAALTVCAMRLISDLHIGRINPQHFQFGLSVDSKKYDLPRFFRERMLTTTNVAALLDSVEPSYGRYHRTRDALVLYTDLAQRD